MADRTKEDMEKDIAELILKLKKVGNLKKEYTERLKDLTEEYDGEVKMEDDGQSRLND